MLLVSLALSASIAATPLTIERLGTADFSMCASLLNAPPTATAGRCSQPPVVMQRGCASWLRWLNGFMSCCWRRVETTPVLWKGKLLRFEWVRGNYGEEPKCPTCGLGKRTHSL